MGFLDKLSGRDAGSKVLWLYVRCRKCGSGVRVRVNLLNPNQPIMPMTEPATRHP